MKLIKIVDSINVAELINNLDISRTRKFNLKVKTYYLLSVITDTNDNYKLNKASDGFHRICSYKMKNILGNTDFYIIRKLLMNPSDPIIVLNGSWYNSDDEKKPGFCQGYCIRLKFNSGEVVFKSIPDKLISKILKYSPYLSKDEEITDHLEFLLNQFTQHNLSFHKDVFTYIRNFGYSLMERGKDNNYHSTLIYNLVGRWLYFINQIESEAVWKSVSAKNHRLNSSITNLSKLLRPFLLCNGELLTCVDVSSSQPYILSALLQKRFYYDTASGFNLKSIYPELYEELVINGQIDTSVNYSSNDFIKYSTNHTGTTSNYYSINDITTINTNTNTNINYNSINNGISSFMWCEFLSPFEINSMQDYIQSPFDSDFYTHTLTLYNPELKTVPINPEMRDKFKGTMMFILFEDNTKHRSNNEQIKIFQSVFPGVDNWVRKIHEMIGNDRFSYLLQRSESYLLLDVVLREFHDLFPNAPLFTIHDAVLTTDRYSKQLNEYIVKRLNEITGVKAGCKIVMHETMTEPKEIDVEAKWKKIKPINSKKKLNKKSAGVFSSNVTRGKEFLKRDI